MTLNLLFAAYTVVLLFSMPGYLQTAMQSQSADQPTLSAVIAITEVVIAGIGVVALFLAFGSYKRWSWIYFANIAVIGLGLLGFPRQLASQLSGGPFQWFFIVGDAVEFASLALLIWMIVALAKYGIWAAPRARG